MSSHPDLLLKQVPTSEEGRAAVASNGIARATFGIAGATYGIAGATFDIVLWAAA